MDETIAQRISQEVEANDVVLFMKGSPVFPQCGFSATVVQVLSHMGIKFKGIDVLQDPGIRQGIKEFSSWPTIPQLYVKGEFVGGCDIIREMFQSGELEELFSEKGVASTTAVQPRSSEEMDQSLTFVDSLPAWGTSSTR